jgi:transposase
MKQAAQEQTGGSVASRRGPRRRHPIAEKLAIIRECLQSGASLAGVALAHQVNANMVRKWVVKYRRGGYDRFVDTGTAMLPVVVKAGSVTQRSSKTPQPRRDATASVEVELPRGVLRLQSIDAALLRALVDALSG